MVSDDEVLGHVHKAPREVPRLGRPEGGVGEALPGAVGGDEVLEHVHPLAEVRRDGIVDDPPRRVGHEAADAGHLPHLAPASPCAAVAHHADGVGVLHVVHDAVRYGSRFLRPEAFLLEEIFVLGQDAHVVFGLELLVLFHGLFRELDLLGGDDDGLDAEAYAAPGCPAIAEHLDVVQHRHHGNPVHHVVGPVEDKTEVFLPELAVDELKTLGKNAVEDDPPGGRLDPLVLPFPLGKFPKPYWSIQLHSTMVEGHEHIVETGEVRRLLSFSPFPHVGEVVYAQHDVLGRSHDGTAARR